MQLKRILSHQGVRKYGPYWILAISVVLSAWFFLGSDYRIEKMLTQNEWHTRSLSRIEPAAFDDVPDLSSSYTTSATVFLPNHSYSRQTDVLLRGKSEDVKVKLIIAEQGKWSVSGGYLTLQPTSFSDVTSGNNESFTTQEMDLLRAFYKLNVLQIRRIDKINNSTLMLTSLNYGSIVLTNK
ncbi:regulatory protein ToxS [Parasalinivibrio latis]|uniref:regulatory protein ToxS n=1 Tax=Parasalinivibrio latis TaxID=2952610 RepID=UPI0030E31943